MMKILHTTLLSLIITSIASLGAQAQELDYTISTASDAPDKCFIVTKPVKSGTPVEITEAACGASERIPWVVSDISVKGGRGIVLGGTPLCVDAQTVDAENPVVLQDCKGIPQQKWEFSQTVENSPGTLRLTDNKNLCLSIPKDGDQVRTSACNGSKDQLWKFIHYTYN